MANKSMLLERLDQDLKAAMRGRETDKVRTLRLVRAALQQVEIERRSEGKATLSDDDVVMVLQKQAKQRRDSIEQYRSAGRDDLVTAESEELAIIESYLPKQLDDEAIREIVSGIINDQAASSISDMGKVMGPAMAKLRGRADGRRVNEIVRELLAGSA